MSEYSTNMYRFAIEDGEGTNLRSHFLAIFTPRTCFIHSVHSLYIYLIFVCFYFLLLKSKNCRSLTFRAQCEEDWIRIWRNRFDFREKKQKLSSLRIQQHHGFCNLFNRYIIYKYVCMSVCTSEYMRSKIK